MDGAETTEAFFCRYYYRIRDAYGRSVLSLVVLGDSDPAWRPGAFAESTGRCRLRFEFPTAKLIDFAGRREELETGDNPAGLVAAAHLESLATHGDEPARATAKIRLLRRLLGRGWTERRIRELFRLIDWLVELPPELDRQVKRQVFEEFEREKFMPFVTSWERIAKEDGRVEGRVEGMVEGMAVALELKFGTAGLAFAEELKSITDLAKLRAVRDAIRSASSPDDLRALLA